ncbi:DNA ligase [Phytophthora cinnamomi]|uniref:DNA ligase n=1 Tax=Phytophthora cinnamomi TaxID=4785 RepID=UPI00355963CD|nr:DNA ligase [Phytophthora cinnamomi]
MAHDRVGKRVRVYWSEEEEWFEGTIQDYDESQGYYVVYDDGDERWEPNGQPMLVEGEEVTQTNENYKALTIERGQDRSPEMMEPPASPGSNYDDEDYDETSHQQLEVDDATKATDPPVDNEVVQENSLDTDNDNAIDSASQQVKDADQQDQDSGVLEIKDDQEDIGISDDRGPTDGDNSDGEASIAESEMPMTFAKNSTKLPGRARPPSATEPKDSANGDYMDRDKLHAQDKRWQRQVELDFLMEKAQTKYQQQNQMVEEVMELQEAVASLKTQVDTLNKSVLRLDILNKKDQHVRDCLLRAAVTSGSKPVKASPRQPNAKTTSKIATASGNNNNTEKDDETSGKHRKEEEWELLTQHRDRLQVDKHKLSLELKALNQQDLDLDNEINDQQSKWERAISTQLFQRQMEKNNAIQVQKALQEMKRRQKSLELSREEEEQWACYQAHQELTQLQIAIQILRDKRGGEPRRLAATRASSSSSTAICDYLTKKIEKQKNKLQQLKAEVEQRRSDYHAMLASGGNESLRKRVQELQKLVFLCNTQASHVKKAERIAQRKGEHVDMEFQRRMFNEQTETEIVLKRSK